MRVAQEFDQFNSVMTDIVPYKVAFDSPETINVRIDTAAEENDKRKSGKLQPQGQVTSQPQTQATPSSAQAQDVSSTKPKSQKKSSTSSEGTRIKKEKVRKASSDKASVIVKPEPGTTPAKPIQKTVKKPVGKTAASTKVASKTPSSSSAQPQSQPTTQPIKTVQPVRPASAKSTPAKSGTSAKRPSSSSQPIKPASKRASVQDPVQLSAGTTAATTVKAKEAVVATSTASTKNTEAAPSTADTAAHVPQPTWTLDKQAAVSQDQPKRMASRKSKTVTHWYDPDLVPATLEEFLARLRNFEQKHKTTRA